MLVSRAMKLVNEARFDQYKSYIDTVMGFQVDDVLRVTYEDGLIWVASALDLNSAIADYRSAVQPARDALNAATALAVATFATKYNALILQLESRTINRQTFRTEKEKLRDERNAAINSQEIAERQAVNAARIALINAIVAELDRLNAQ